MPHEREARTEGEPVEANATRERGEDGGERGQIHLASPREGSDTSNWPQREGQIHPVGPRKEVRYIQLAPERGSDTFS